MAEGGGECHASGSPPPSFSPPLPSAAMLSPFLQAPRFPFFGGAEAPGTAAGCPGLAPALRVSVEAVVPSGVLGVAWRGWGWKSIPLDGRKGAV